MSLNIKNEETHKKAQELAALTGESLTTAVSKAVEERLLRMKSKGMKERIAKIRREVTKELKGNPLPDHADLLYDERGLPK